jgi:hypothetical protein
MTTIIGWVIILVNRTDGRRGWGGGASADQIPGAAVLPLTWADRTPRL